MDGGSTDLAVGVEQDGEDVVPGAPGSLALPQQVRGGAVADTRVSRPHLQGQSRASLQDQDCRHGFSSSSTTFVSFNLFQ